MSASVCTDFVIFSFNRSGFPGPFYLYHAITVLSKAWIVYSVSSLNKSKYTVLPEYIPLYQEVLIETQHHHNSALNVTDIFWDGKHESFKYYNISKVQIFANM
jgi:hypothetical protein